jgi:hypothetical protein
MSQRNTKRNELMGQVFGEFSEYPIDSREFLTFGFVPRDQQLWKKNGLLADMLADYVAIFFITDASDPNCVKKQKQIKGIVSYIANELLQNATQYHDDNLGSINIQVQLSDDSLVLYVTNSIPPNQVAHFRSFIQQLLNTDPEEFYISQMTRDIEDDDITASGLGLLTMTQDYGAKLGWQFDIVQKQPKKTTITTMVHLAI